MDQRTYRGSSAYFNTNQPANFGLSSEYSPFYGSTRYQVPLLGSSQEADIQQFANYGHIRDSHLQFENSDVIDDRELTSFQDAILSQIIADWDAMSVDSISASIDDSNISTNHEVLVDDVGLTNSVQEINLKTNESIQNIASDEHVGLYADYLNPKPDVRHVETLSEERQRSYVRNGSVRKRSTASTSSKMDTLDDIGLLDEINLNRNSRDKIYSSTGSFKKPVQKRAQTVATESIRTQSLSPSRNGNPNIKKRSSSTLEEKSEKIGSSSCPDKTSAAKSKSNVEREIPTGTNVASTSAVKKSGATKNGNDSVNQDETGKQNSTKENETATKTAGAKKDKGSRKKNKKKHSKRKSEDSTYYTESSAQFLGSIIEHTAKTIFSILMFLTLCLFLVVFTVAVVAWKLFWKLFKLACIWGVVILLKLLSLCIKYRAARRTSRIGCHANIELPGSGDEAIKRLLNCKGKDPYSVLGLTVHCTDEDIKKYYKRQAILVHPDKNGEPLAEEAFKILAHAFSLVGDPAKRKEFHNKMCENQDQYMWNEFAEGRSEFEDRMEEDVNEMRCEKCGRRHNTTRTDRPAYIARYCQDCDTYHPAANGDLWAETFLAGLMRNYFTCVDGVVYNVTDWCLCQMKSLHHLQANAHNVQCRLSTDNWYHNGGGDFPRTEEELREFLRNRPSFGAEKMDAGFRERSDSGPKRNRRRR